MSQSDSHSPSSTSVNKFTFHGKGGEFFGIWIVNILLTIVTFGIYSAWAKVRTNNYLYGNTELGGDRFEYLALPMQILVGRIIAMTALVAWSSLSATHPIASMVLLAIFMLAMPYLAVRNTQFDARMTRFRNVRFNFVGTYLGSYINLLFKPIAAYAVLIASPMLIVWGAKQLSSSTMMLGAGSIVAGIAFIVLSVFAYAWVTVGMTQFIVNGYRYGDKAFSAVLSEKAYAKIALSAAGLFFLVLFIVGFIAAITIASMGTAVSVSEIMQGDFQDLMQDPKVVMFLVGGYASMLFISFGIAAYVKVRTRNYLFNQTKLNDEFQIASNMTVLGFLWLIISNLLIVVLTLGLGHPWTVVRSARYFANVTDVQGDLTTLSVGDHNEQSNNAIADEMVDAFDINLSVI